MKSTTHILTTALAATALLVPAASAMPLRDSGTHGSTAAPALEAAKSDGRQFALVVRIGPRAV